MPDTIGRRESNKPRIGELIHPTRSPGKAIWELDHPLSPPGLCADLGISNTKPMSGDINHSAFATGSPSFDQRNG